MRRNAWRSAEKLRKRITQEALSENASCVMGSVFLLSNGLSFRFDKTSLLFVPVLVIEAEHRIGCHKEPVQEVEPEDEIKFSGDLVKTSRDVSDDDQAEKNVTFSRGILDLDSLHNGERPAETEADQHEGLENTGQRHKKNSLVSLL